MDNQWMISYARFLNFPHFSSSPSPSMFLIPKLSLSNGRTGTWISSASSSVLLRLIKHPRNPLSIVISIGGRNLEEHCISNLHFSWPQVASPEYPHRGSKVVFASYGDENYQVQKFAMQFSASSDSRAFVSSVQECLKDDLNMKHLNINCSSNISVPSNFNKGLRGREATNQCNALSAVSRESITLLPPIFKERQQCPETVAIAQNVGRPCSSFSSNFAALRSDTCTKKEVPNLPADIIWKSQLEKNTTAASFFDTLDMLEKAINQCGGNLRFALE